MKRFLLALVAALILTFTQSPAQASVEGYIQKKCQSDYGKSKAHEKALYYAPLIRHYAAKYHIEPMLLAAIVYHESNFNPRCVSPCGAVGLMQVMPFHFADMGMSARLCFNASTNLDIGCHIFAGYRTRMAFIYMGSAKGGYHQPSPCGIQHGACLCQSRDIP